MCKGPGTGLSYSCFPPLQSSSLGLAHYWLLGLSSDFCYQELPWLVEGKDRRKVTNSEGTAALQRH
ncbi:hypothetical protein ACRRTK_010017 [Alexandromys fortis]